MSPQTWWYVARASGIVAWALLTISVVWGLLLSTRVLGRKPTPAWLTDLHRFLGGFAVVFTGVHLVGLVADNYVHFGAADIFVPFAASWRPAAVAAGVVAMYLLVAVEVTSLFMRRLPRRWWRAIHQTGFLAFFLAGTHGALAGADARNVFYVVGSLSAFAAVVFLSVARLIAGRGKLAPGRADTKSAPAHPRPRPPRLRSIGAESGNPSANTKTAA